MTHNVYVYIFLAALISYLLRVVPVTVFRKPIRNRRVRAFLYYVPYVTLAVMTFPAIISAAGCLSAGVAALIVGGILAWKTGSLPLVASACCIVAFLTDLAVRLLAGGF